MIYLHIGMHKTGTTSLQRFLSDKTKALKLHDYQVYTGCLQNPMNHIELHLYALNSDRDTFATYNFPSLVMDQKTKKYIQKSVHTFLNNSTKSHQIFSNEGLSWLRFDTELERLKELMQYPPSEVKVILYLRDKEEFLRSYKGQIYKKKNRYPSTNHKSVLYIESDSWIIDYDSLVTIYEKHFGAKNLIIIDYDEEMRKHNNIIPSFLHSLNLTSVAWDYENYFLNES